MCSPAPATLAPSYLDLERQRDRLWDEVIAMRGKLAAAEAKVKRLREALRQIEANEAYQCKPLCPDVPTLARSAWCPWCIARRALEATR